MPVKNSSVICESEKEISHLKHCPQEHIDSMHDNQSVNSIRHLLISPIPALSGVKHIDIETDGEEDKGGSIDEDVEDESSLEEALEGGGLDEGNLRLRIGPLWGNRR